ncbi:MAG: hypothetical protein ACF8OB_09325, partial [Phycisphaeraceae bacterium JB051]
HRVIASPAKCIDLLHSQSATIKFHEYPNHLQKERSNILITKLDRLSQENLILTKFFQANLRTQLQRIIQRAGLEAWPMLWQNLRSTRETELADQIPAHVASTWIGNSVAVAVKHYLQVTDDHFKQAAQNTAQKLHESTRNKPKLVKGELTTKNITSSHCGNLHKITTPCELQGVVEMGDTGLEPVTSSV